MKKRSAFVDNATLGVFRLFSGRLGKRLRESQYDENKEQWEAPASGFIEHQSRLTQISYGKAGPLARKLFFRGRPLSAAENACEVIAVHNALLALGQPEDFPELLKSFSEGGICFNGIFGTSPKAVERFLLGRGLRLHSLKAGQIDEASLNELAEECRCFIFTAFNRGQNPFHKRKGRLYRP